MAGWACSSGCDLSLWWSPMQRFVNPALNWRQESQSSMEMSESSPPFWAYHLIQNHCTQKLIFTIFVGFQLQSSVVFDSLIQFSLQLQFLCSYNQNIATGNNTPQRSSNFSNYSCINYIEVMISQEWWWAPKIANHLWTCVCMVTKQPTPQKITHSSNSSLDKGSERTVCRKGAEKCYAKRFLWVGDLGVHLPKQKKQQ